MRAKVGTWCHGWRPGENKHISGCSQLSSSLPLDLGLQGHGACSPLGCRRREGCRVGGRVRPDQGVTWGAMADTGKWDFALGLFFVFVFL